jgi:hypothetical protein
VTDTNNPNDVPFAGYGLMRTDNRPYQSALHVHTITVSSLVEVAFSRLRKKENTRV